MRRVTAYCVFCGCMCAHTVDGDQPPALACLQCSARQTLAPPGGAIRRVSCIEPGDPHGGAHRGHPRVQPTAQAPRA